MYTFFVALFDAVKAGERKIEGKRVEFDLAESLLDYGLKIFLFSYLNHLNRVPVNTTISSSWPATVQIFIQLLEGL